MVQSKALRENTGSQVRCGKQLTTGCFMRSALGSQDPKGPMSRDVLAQEEYGAK